MNKIKIFIITTLLVLNGAALSAQETKKESVSKVDSLQNVVDVQAAKIDQLEKEKQDLADKLNKAENDRKAAEVTLKYKSTHGGNYFPLSTFSIEKPEEINWFFRTVQLKGVMFDKENPLQYFGGKNPLIKGKIKDITVYSYAFGKKPQEVHHKVFIYYKDGRTFLVRIYNNAIYTELAKNKIGKSQYGPENTAPFYQLRKFDTADAYARHLVDANHFIQYYK